MKQRLGLDYTLNNPKSYIISQRLMQLQQHYSGTELASSMIRSLDNRNMKFIDVHTGNLIQTYGKDAVKDAYTLIYGDIYKKLSKKSG